MITGHCIDVLSEYAEKHDLNGLAVISHDLLKNPQSEKTHIMHISQKEYALIWLFQHFPGYMQDTWIDVLKDSMKKIPTIALGPIECFDGKHNEQTPKPIQKDSRVGYCYIGIDSNWKGYYKIGRTIDPTCKTRQNSTINPNYKIIYRTKMGYEHSEEVEKEIHNSLSNNHIADNACTEWFKLSDEELNNIINKYNFVKLEEL